MRLPGAYKVVKHLEDRTLRAVEEYNRELKELGLNYFLKLVKDVERVDGQLMVRYRGVRWYDDKGGEIVTPPPDVVEKLKVPPRWPLEGLKCYVLGDDVLIEYRDYVRFRGVLNVDYEIMDPDMPSRALEELRSLAPGVRDELKAKLGIDIRWLPLKRLSIIDKLSAKLGVTPEDLEDLLLIMSERGLIKVDVGETGELWLDVDSLKPQRS